MRRPLIKTVEFTSLPQGYMVTFIVNGQDIATVFFDECKRLGDLEIDETTAFLVRGAIVMIESSRLFDLFCKFRKQDEAPEVLTVDGADSSRKRAPCDSSNSEPSDYGCCNKCSESVGYSGLNFDGLCDDCENSSSQCTQGGAA